jgi:hypothetical protein
MEGLKELNCLNGSCFDAPAFIKTVNKTIDKVYESKIFQVRSVTWNNKIKKKESSKVKLRLDPELLRYGITSLIRDDIQGVDDEECKSLDSRDAWKTIKRLCGINSAFAIRMANVMKIVHPITQESVVSNDDDAISASVIKRLIELQGAGSTVHDDEMRITFPVTDYQIKGMLRRWQCGKGLAFDGWSDEIFNKEHSRRSHITFSNSYGRFLSGPFQHGISHVV